MNFNVRSIGSKYQEMTVDEMDTRTLDKKESIQLAQKMISAAEDLLYHAGLKANSDACGSIVEDLTEHL